MPAFIIIDVMVSSALVTIIRRLPQRFHIDRMFAMLFSWLVLSAVISLSTSDLYDTTDPKNVGSRPVIGIMTQKTDREYTTPYGTTYMYSAVVKWAESGGALVVPIRINRHDSYYHDLMTKINGIILPGGHVDLLESWYTKAFKILFEIAKQKNDAGDYFPIWGLCLGFEVLVAVVEGKTLTERCDAEDLNIPLIFGPGYEESKHLNLMPDDLKTKITTDNLTGHFHVKCVLTETFYNSTYVKDFFRLSSRNFDRNGTEFVSSIEAINYPFYGLGFHPEKFNFLWRPDFHLVHNLNSVRLSQYFANFFVEEARKSTNKYPNETLLFREIINNYRHVYTGYPLVYDFVEFYDYE